MDIVNALVAQYLLVADVGYVDNGVVLYQVDVGVPVGNHQGVVLLAVGDGRVAHIRHARYLRQPCHITTRLRIADKSVLTGIIDKVACIGHHQAIVVRQMIAPLAHCYLCAKRYVDHNEKKQGEERMRHATGKDQ